MPHMKEWAHTYDHDAEMASYYHERLPPTFRVSQPTWRVRVLSSRPWQ